MKKKSKKFELHEVEVEVHLKKHTDPYFLNLQVETESFELQVGVLKKVCWELGVTKNQIADFFVKNHKFLGEVMY